MGKIAVALTVVIAVLMFALAEGPQSAQPPLAMAIFALFVMLGALVHLYGPPSAD
jgi:predicted membrane-bound spermidine synthase